jgi:hypothetical protein
MTFSKMMEAGKERKDAIKAAMLVKMAAIQQAKLNYKDAVREANLRYQKKLSVK